MKKMLCMMLAMLMLLSMFAGCSNEPAVSGSDAVTEEPVPTVNVYDDGRARPSSCGQLQVLNGKLCSESGQPVMLRGVSSYGLATGESFINDTLFGQLSKDYGINIFRLALYTSGVGIIGYNSGGDQARLELAIENGVNYAKLHDMYALIDWHILRDGDPNYYLEEAKVFWAKMAEKYCDYNNVLYEICNEPNGVTWQEVKDYANAIIPIIRERDPDAVIIVGNPDWSKDLYTVLADPLDYENIMYTFHFYAASHKDDFRKMVEETSQSGLPIFVTEYGVTAASGGFPRDLESADLWIELLEKENISHCMWSFSTVHEPCSAVRHTVLRYCDYTEEDFTITGQWLMDMIEKNNSMGNIPAE